MQDGDGDHGHDHDGDGVAQHGGHTALVYRVGVYYPYFFDIGHLCYDKLTPFKTRYPLTSIS